MSEDEDEGESEMEEKGEEDRAREEELARERRLRGRSRVKWSLNEVDDVYRQERFNSLGQVMHLLSLDSDAGAAREGIRRQLEACNKVYDDVVEKHHDVIRENTVRHGEALELYKTMNAQLKMLHAEINESRRLLQPQGMDTLVQLRMKRAMLTSVIDMIAKVEEIVSTPSDVQELILQQNFLSASQKVMSALKLLEASDLTDIAQLQPTKRQLIMLKESCVAAMSKELRKHIYGCEDDPVSGKGRPIADWLHGDGTQKSLMAALDILQQFGGEVVAKTCTDLAASLQTELTKCVETLGVWMTEKGRDVGGKGMNYAVMQSVELVKVILYRLQSVLKMHILVVSSLSSSGYTAALLQSMQSPQKQTRSKGRDQPPLPPSYTVGLVWTGIQIQVLEVLSGLVGSPIMGSVLRKQENSSKEAEESSSSSRLERWSNPSEGKEGKEGKERRERREERREEKERKESKKQGDLDIQFSLTEATRASFGLHNFRSTLSFSSSSLQSSYLLIALIKQVRQFAEEADGLTAIESSPDGDQLEGAKLTSNLEAFIERVVLHDLEAHYLRRIRERELPILESAFQVDMFLQEIMAVGAALPEHVDDLMKIWNVVIKEYCSSARDNLSELIEGFSVKSVVASSDLLNILEMDPLFRLLPSSSTSPSDSSISSEELEAFAVLEHLRIDPALFLNQDAEKPILSKHSDDDLWLNGYAGIQRILDQLARCHHSVYWLSERQGERRQQLGLQSFFELPVLSSQASGTNLLSNSKPMMWIISDVIKCSGIVSSSGGCTFPKHSKDGIVEMLQVAQESFIPVAHAALISCRLLVRWATSRSVRLLFRFCISLSYSAATDTLRILEQLKRQWERYDQALQAGMERTRATYVMGSLPLLLYHYFSKLAADTNAVNKANLPNVERALGSVYQQLQALGSLNPLAKILNIDARFNRTMLFLRLLLIREDEEAVAAFKRLHSSSLTAHDYQLATSKKTLA
ncbi:Sec8 protein [Guillardia theta CCMP2712]|uniref:Exocyst complex component Sec8 n=2 Tax=Guillardia theta TaxID=55529 RepID=L1JHZ7_GUITC|nr:Sec8 protein [Guillardia theta CCMP2712]EKX48121.1 Sec8 protein [Guillardia theta CCMP2712]|eukprot:XP_005835101.1 Sec8 protein [Guillardia theta CCMP2712]